MVKFGNSAYRGPMREYRYGFLKGLSVLIQDGSILFLLRNIKSSADHFS